MRYLRLALFLLSTAVYGLDYRTLQPHGYVSDFAGVMDAGSKAKLEAYCASLERSAQVQLAIVTIKSLEGEPIEDFANNLYRHWGIGRKSADEGLLLLLAIEDRQHRLEVGRGLEPIIPDGYSGSVLRAMRPALREARYADAVFEAAHVLGERIAQAKGVALQPLPRPSPGVPESGSDDGGIPFPLLVLGAIVLLMLLSGGGRGGRRRGGGFFPIIFPPYYGGYHGSSRGGFGGFDSGGGFGGFGGGDSGGGGASSSW